MIRLLTTNDYETWLTLAKEVEPLFGPLVNSKEFQEGINDCIKNKNAYCVEDEDHNVVGIIALNRKENEIAWLAVGEKFRGNKYGDKLLKKAIEELEEKGNIYVQTFSSITKEGKNARKLYEKNGFKDLKNAGKNPAQIETVIMLREKGQVKE